MKLVNEIIILSLLLFVAPALATAYPGQYPWDPLYFELKENPLQGTERARKENQKEFESLKSQYGINDFYSCYACANQDISNPSDEANCVLQTRYCLEDNKRREEFGNNLFNSIQRFNCPAGSIYSNRRCVTNDVFCQESFGLNSVYVKTDSYSEIQCGCKSGYQFENKVCVLKKEDKDTGCKNKYGPNSYFTGEKYICNCNVGHEWRDNLCVPKTDKSQLTAQPGEILNNEGIRILKSIDWLAGKEPSRPDAKCEEFNAFFDVDGLCKCVNGYGYSESRKLCVKKLEVPKPKISPPPPPIIKNNKENVTGDTAKKQQVKKTIDRPTEKKDSDKQVIKEPDIVPALESSMSGPMSSGGGLTSPTEQSNNSKLSARVTDNWKTFVGFFRRLFNGK